MSFVVSSFADGSILPAAKLTQIQSNFAAFAFQESGAPIPGAFKANAGFNAVGASSFDTVQCASGYSVGGQAIKGLVQRVFMAKPTGPAVVNSLFTWTNYLVASLTPKFADSQFRIAGTISGEAGNGAGTIAQMQTHLARFPNSGATILLGSSDSFTGYSISGGSTAINNLLGQVAFEYSEASPGLGMPLQYGVNFRQMNSGGFAIAIAGQMAVEEWR